MKIRKFWKIPPSKRMSLIFAANFESSQKCLSCKVTNVPHSPLVVWSDTSFNLRNLHYHLRVASLAQSIKALQLAYFCRDIGSIRGQPIFFAISSLLQKSVGKNEKQVSVQAWLWAWRASGDARAAGSVGVGRLLYTVRRVIVLSQE